MVNLCAGVVTDPTSRLAVLYAGTGTGTVVVCGITVCVGTTVAGAAVCRVVITGGGFEFCWTQPPITIIPSTITAKIHDVRIFSPTPFPHPSPGRTGRIQGNERWDIYSLTFLTDFEKWTVRSGGHGVTMRFTCRLFRSLIRLIVGKIISQKLSCMINFKSYVDHADSTTHPRLHNLQLAY